MRYDVFERSPGCQELQFLDVAIIGAIQNTTRDDWGEIVDSSDDMEPTRGFFVFLKHTTLARIANRRCRSNGGNPI